MVQYSNIQETIFKIIDVRKNNKLIPASSIRRALCRKLSAED